MFGCDRLQDSTFLHFLSSQLSTNYSNFEKSVETWFDGGMKSKRGGRTLSLEVRQTVSDTWIDHTVASTDNRNNRATVQISKMEYLQRHHGIEYKIVQVEEKMNKRGQVNMSANRMIVTDTVRSMQKSMLEKGIDVSIGSILNLQPFFVTYASEKEMSLCLCKLCLNTKFLFDSLISKAKKDGDECFDSITAFFMAGCSCPKGENGYHKWSCSIRKCKDCKNVKPSSLKCSTSMELVTVDQFELVEREYKKLNPKTGIIELKKTKLTERVSKQMTYQELYKKLSSLRTEYCTHKYLVYNDNYQWPRILATIPDYGLIYHMDYSENMAQMHKYEVQSAHFNKRNYSLHCTVEHLDGDKHPNLKSPYFYHYHLSDEMTHDSAFTSVVFERCLETGDLPEIIRNKSDNCSTQYKCGKAFNEYLKLAKKYDRNVIKYYGPSGHGKGLVDAMSAFGVKTQQSKQSLQITPDTIYLKISAMCYNLDSKVTIRKNIR